MTTETQPSEFEDLTLDNVCAGAAMEAFENELQKVVENILDVNTKAEAKRSVTLKLTFLPSEERDDMKVVLETATKLAPFKTASGVAFIGRARNGKAKAVAHNAQQLRFRFNEGGKPELVKDPEAEPEQAKKAE